MITNAFSVHQLYTPAMLRYTFIWSKFEFNWILFIKLLLLLYNSTIILQLWKLLFFMWHYFMCTEEKSCIIFFLQIYIYLHTRYVWFKFWMCTQHHEWEPSSFINLNRFFFVFRSQEWRHTYGIGNWSSNHLQKYSWDQNNWMKCRKVSERKIHWK